jgi:hypothetical protein
MLICFTAGVDVIIFCHSVFLDILAGVSGLGVAPTLMVSQVHGNLSCPPGASMPFATSQFQAPYVSIFGGGVEGNGHGLGMGIAGVAHGGTINQAPVSGELRVPIIVCGWGGEISNGLKYHSSVFKQCMVVNHMRTESCTYPALCESIPDIFILLE